MEARDRRSCCARTAGSRILRTVAFSVPRRARTAERPSLRLIRCRTLAAAWRGVGRSGARAIGHRANGIGIPRRHPRPRRARPVERFPARKRRRHQRRAAVRRRHAFPGRHHPPAVGATVNTEGYTSRAYVDARWEYQTPSGIFFGLGLGGTVHDGCWTPPIRTRRRWARASCSTSRSRSDCGWTSAAAFRSTSSICRTLSCSTATKASTASACATATSSEPRASEWARICACHIEGAFCGTFRGPIRCKRRFAMPRSARIAIAVCTIVIGAVDARAEDPPAFWAVTGVCLQRRPASARRALGRQQEPGADSRQRPRPEASRLPPQPAAHGPVGAHERRPAPRGADAVVPRGISRPGRLGRRPLPQARWPANSAPGLTSPRPASARCSARPPRTRPCRGCRAAPPARLAGASRCRTRAAPACPCR